MAIIYARFGSSWALIQPESKALFCVETLLFEGLYTLVLELAGEVQQLISLPIRRALIRQLLHRLHREKQLGYFQAIAQKQSLAEQVLSFIDEVKQPSCFAAAICGAHAWRQGS